MIVEIIPCLSDNYSYLIFEKKTRTVSIVDPSDFETCDQIIKKYKKLDYILNTHHHLDHVSGNLELKNKYNSKIIGYDGDKAQQIMLAVHTHGKGVCGIFTREIAETKSSQINNFAKENGHPLLSDIEEVDEDD